VDARSESFFPRVHPDLVKVLRAAAQTPQAFEVVYGLRTLAAEAEAVATGHSKTLHSRHLPNAAGLSCAVDVAALIDGKVSFAPGHEEFFFGAIAAQVKAAAAKLEVPIQWGGDHVGAWTPGVVSTFRDWGHFQLPWLQYP
jgi:peptidoglycan L-alanyl-D-glutamate endopeptidase CwlK